MNLVSLYGFPVLVIASVVLDLGSTRKVVPRIYGGSFASNGQFPFYGYIAYGGSRFCGASIIHRRWALTAAHCALPRDYPTLVVGKVDEFSSGTSYGIVEFYVHRNFIVIPEELNNNLEYVVDDIAVVRVDSDIYNAATVQLSRGAPDNYANQIATIVGWGRTFYHETTPVTNLRYADVRVLPMAECRMVWTYADKHLCTANRDYYGTKGVCNGDSGSPVVIGNVQIGIVSTTDKYCESMKPDLHVKVADYVPWIRSALAKHQDYLP